jgi:2'-5' RNA ligase
VSKIETSVELTFDRRLTETIQCVWEAFTNEKIEYELPKEQSLPHITLGIGDATENALQPFQALIQRLTQFKVRFDSIGMFMSPRGPNYSDNSIVLFLSPKPTDFLLEANRLTAKELRGWNRGKRDCYRPEHWVPHCTLAEHLAKADIPKALMICEDKMDWPVAGSIRGIRLVNFGEGELQVVTAQLLPRSPRSK